MIDWFKLHSLEFFSPASALGAVFYAAVFLFAAGVCAELLRGAVKRLLQKDAHKRIDLTYAIFLTKFGVIAVYGVFAMFYAHLIPALHSFATLLLTGASIVSVVLGLAAQSTLGNMVSGIAILFYRPFRVGDTIIVAVPGGSEKGIVQQISLGYTVIVTEDHRRIMVPNGVALGTTIINLTPSQDGGSF
jgi:small-conductance mechanosensitive channel